MLKIAVIGGKDTVIGFKAVGLEACPATNAAEALYALRELTKEGSEYAIELQGPCGKRSLAEGRCEAAEA